MEKSMASSLVRVNTLALMLLGNFRTKNPTAGQEVITYIPSFHLFIESEAAKKFRRIQGHLTPPLWIVCTTVEDELNHISPPIWRPQLDIPWWD